MAKPAAVTYPREVEEPPSSTHRSFRCEISPTHHVVCRTASLTDDTHTVFPFTPEGEPKFQTIQSISFEGFKHKFPAGFYKSFMFGYGPTRTLYPLFNGVQEHLSVSEVVVSKLRATEVKGNQLVVNARDVEEAFTIFAALLRDHKEDIQESSKVVLNKILPNIFPASVRKYQKGGLASYVKTRSVNGSALSPGDVQAALGLTKRQDDSLRPSSDPKCPSNNRRALH